MSVSEMLQMPGQLSSTVRKVIQIRRAGYLEFFVDTWHKQGDFSKITIGPITIFLAVHPDQVKHIAIDSRNKYDKRASYDMVRKLLLGNGLLTSTGEEWRRQRKLMSPFFTPRGIEQYTAVMFEEGKLFIDRWDKLARSGQTVDIIDEMMKITASIILKAMFSKSTDLATIQMKDAVETLIGTVTLRNLSPVALPLWLPTASNKRYFAARKKVDDYINTIIQERRNLPQEQWPNDLLTRLMITREEETGQLMNDRQVLDEAITIFFAGHETTARTLSFTWYALAQNPDVAAKLQAELATLPADRVPDLDDLKKLSYGLQVIKETLRLYPAAPIYSRDAVEDDTMLGQAIPVGAKVLLSPFLTHRHPDFWPDPLRFDPDRWTPEREKAQHPQAYHPFAAGQRICIGNNFSLLESHILLALLAARFAPRLVPGPEIKLEMAGTLNVPGGIAMVIERRSGKQTN